MEYNFDKIINRQNTNAMSVDGFRDYLFDPEDQLDLPCPDDQLQHMWVADMEFETAPEIIQALRDRLDHGIFGYTKVFGHSYKESFCQWTQGRYGYKYNKDHMVTSQGIIPALFDLIGYICRSDEKVLIMTPSYAFFKHAADFNNIEIVRTDLVQEDGQFYMDYDDIRLKAGDEKVKLCIFCSPHNPTGRIWTDSELSEFAQICLDNNVMIISDEIHCDLLRKGKVFTPLLKLFPGSDQIITCMSPSKTFNLAGFMFANVIIPNDQVRHKWNQRAIDIDNPLSITAAQAAYSSGGNWLDQLTAYLDANFQFLNDYLEKYLPKARFSIPDSTYLAWINLKAYLPNEENLTLFFANKAGVLLEGGNMFVSNADGYIRLNVACPRSRLKQGLKRITKAVLEDNN